MPTGIPGSGKGGYRLITRDDLRQRLKDLEARIKQMDRRDKAFGDLKKWLATRKLDHKDLWWMYRQMLPKRASAPVKSKKPLHAIAKGNGKEPVRRGDPEFRRAIQKARVDQKLTIEQVGKKLGISGSSVANWEAGRYVPKEEARQKLLKALNLPAHLGAEATEAMMASMGGRGHSHG